MRVLLIAGPITSTNIDLTTCHSVEAGYADRMQHFDHHGEYSNHPSPCAGLMPAIHEDSTIYITHMDADTYIGLRKLMGMIPPPLQLDLMEAVDLNGPDVVSDGMFNFTLAYMVGVSNLAHELGMPGPQEEAVDVTHIVEIMHSYGWATICELGGYAMIESDKAIRNVSLLHAAG